VLLAMTALLTHIPYLLSIPLSLRFITFVQKLLVSFEILPFHFRIFTDYRICISSRSAHSTARTTVCSPTVNIDCNKLNRIQRNFADLCYRRFSSPDTNGYSSPNGCSLANGYSHTNDCSRANGYNHTNGCSRANV
jgi:hypothetical protein